MDLRLILFLFITIFISGCVGSNGASNGNNNTPFELSCSDTLAYIGFANPVSYTGTDTPTTTEIVIHGKSGSPISTHLVPLYTDS